MARTRRGRPCSTRMRSSRTLLGALRRTTRMTTTTVCRACPMIALPLTLSVGWNLAMRATCGVTRPINRSG
eukprot:6434673-Prymnesium_polylepis.1